MYRAKSVVTRIARYVLYLWLPALLLVLWWYLPHGHSLYFPSLWVILDNFRQLWLFHLANVDLRPSIEHFFIGYPIAVVGGIALGVLLALVNPVYQLLLPIITFFRGLPSIALIPPLLLILGLGGTFKVGIIVLGAGQAVLLNTINGMRSIDEVQLETARAYGLTRWQRIFRVMLPGASPQIVAGCRTAVQAAVLLMVASEIIASTSGIGFEIVTAQQSFDGAGMWSGMLMLGIVGIILNLAFILCERRVLRWHNGMRAKEANS